MAIRLFVLAALLLCLCCSRGEGLHLLPFAADAPRQSSFASSPKYRSYQYSPDPQNASALKHSTKKVTVDNVQPADVTTMIAPGLGIVAYSTLARTGKQTLSRTKFELTSASDRSPPPLFVSQTRS